MPEPKRQRLLVIAINFAPELTGIGKYVGEMTAHMAEAGIEIRVVTAPPYYPAWSVQAPYRAGRYVKERLAGADVYRCPIFVTRRPGGLLRILHLLSFAASSLPVVLWQALFWRPDLVFVVEPPLACAPGALLAARLCGARAWLHVQDFEVDAAFTLGVLRMRWARTAALAAERWMMRRFDKVSSISGRMLETLRNKGVPTDRIAYFPNWVDTQQICPQVRENSLRAALGISSQTTVLLYSGNMGEKQGLGVLVEAARAFTAADGVLFLMCGDGSTRPRIEQAAAGLDHVRFIPLQPQQHVNDLLNLADIHLLPQRADAEDLVMPSKLTAIMASGRPVVATASAGSELAKAAAQGGLVVESGDLEAFLGAVRSLLDDPDLRQRLGTSGRAYAVQHWERSNVLARALSDVCGLVAQN